MEDIKNMMDYNNYGGGVMLGVKKIIVKGHGSSKPNAIKNKVSVSIFITSNINYILVYDEILIFSINKKLFNPFLFLKFQNHLRS